MEPNTLFTQPPLGQQQVYIGIHPGSVNGLAIYSKERGLRIHQLSFWKMMKYLNDKVLPAIADKRIVVKGFIKASHKNKFHYNGKITKQNRDTALMMARNSGMNGGYCKLVIEWFEFNKIEAEEMVPNSFDREYDPTTFYRLTGQQTAETATQCREAARFIERFWRNKP